MRKINFENNIVKILNKNVPDRPTLFEFIISYEAETALTGYKVDPNDFEAVIKRRIKAFSAAGYDFVPLLAGGFGFVRNSHTIKSSYSLNEGGIIFDRESYEKYHWNNPDDYDHSIIEKLSKELPDGMKFLIYSNDGVLENTVGITGYENLCYMLADDRELVGEIIKNIGERLCRYYELTIGFNGVGAAFCNDDWGFKNSTMLSHEDLKEFVYPYHKRIVDIAHKHNKKCVMHSCGNFDGIYEDLYNVIGFDGKHSNEDTILPVEEAYRRYRGKIAIMGGIDVNFLCRATVSEIEERCNNMLKISEKEGGYALGSGNSIPSFVPLKNYFTMIKCANKDFSIR